MNENNSGSVVKKDDAQKYRTMNAGMKLMVILFAIMTFCMVWVSLNSQQIANQAAKEAMVASQETINNAVLKALETVGEMEVISETTTTTHTAEGDNATINNVEGEQYNDQAVNGGAD